MRIFALFRPLTNAVIASGTHEASDNQDKIFTWTNISRYIFVSFNLVGMEKAADAWFVTFFAPNHHFDAVSIMVIGLSGDLPTLLNSRLQDLCIFMYKVKHKLCPAYISNIFKEPNSNYNLRQADFSIPRYETVTYGKHSIRYLGPRLWTKLPKSIRDVTTLTSFKSKIRQLNISELLDDGCAGCSLCSFWLLCIFTINLLMS